MRALIKTLIIVLAIQGGAARPVQAQDWIDHLSRSTMMITRNNGGGTGFVIRARSGVKYILTNQHVCGSKMGKVYDVLLGDVTFRAKSVAKDFDHDLCILTLSKKYADVPALKLAEELNKMDDLYTVGFPLLKPLRPSQGRYIGDVIEGSNSAPGPTGCEIPTVPMGAFLPNGQLIMFCQKLYNESLTTILAAPGASGSPVINEHGRIVGIIHSVETETMMAGMIRFEFIRKFLDKF